MEVLPPIVKIIEEDCEIPQLGKHRRISALLPANYEETDKKYPVLYLQDGQNLFNPNAPFGDWAIDKSMERLALEGCGDLIVIAIDHGEQERIKEYQPFQMSKVGAGDGAKYMEFVLKKLKPYVDNKYRVKPDRLSTGIGGSSMGGLISLYAGLTHPEVFAKMMIFSPSLWIAPMINRRGFHFLPLEPTHLYLYSGGKESKYHIPNVERFASALLKYKQEFPNLKFKLSINPHGEHQERYWGQEFPTAVKWLFFND